MSQDPGGTNAIIPVISALGRDYSITVIAKDNAVSIYRNHGITCIDVTQLTDDYGVESLKSVLSIFMPDVIITGTSSMDLYERKIWVAARELSICSIALLDSWCYYGLRFSDYTFMSIENYCESTKSTYLPDYVFTMDDESMEALIREGMPESRIRVVGQPFLQDLRDEYREIDMNTIEKYKQERFGDKEKKIILFASDNLSDSFSPDGYTYWGYDEKSIFNTVYDAIMEKCNNDDYMILIRPHPKEKIDKWEGLINQHHSDRIPLRIDDSSTEKMSIMVADLIIGMWSMVLIEGVLAHKRVLSVQIGAKRKPDFVLEDRGVLSPIYEKKALYETFDLFFSGDMGVGMAHWDVGNDATKRITSIISEVV